MLVQLGVDLCLTFAVAEGPDAPYSASVFVFTSP